MIKILIVDDHQLVRIALRKILMNDSEIQVVGEAADGTEAICKVRELKPEIVLMDIQLPDLTGLEVTQKLLKVYPRLKIIALTAHDEDPFPASFIKAGAVGYLTKNTDVNELITAIHTVHMDHPYVTPSITHHLVQLQQQSSPITELSKRELQVMWMILKGNKLKDIATKINISIKTVSTYRTRIFEKLKVNNDVELTQFAIRHGILNNFSLK